MDEEKYNKWFGFKSYEEYLMSWQWQDKREHILRLEVWRCQRCKQITDKPQFHHLNYNSVGFERREDLLLLCPSCHKKEHNL